MRCESRPRGPRCDPTTGGERGRQGDTDKPRRRDGSAARQPRQREDEGVATVVDEQASDDHNVERAADWKHRFWKDVLESTPVADKRHWDKDGTPTGVERRVDPLSRLERRGPTGPTHRDAADSGSGGADGTASRSTPGMVATPPRLLLTSASKQRRTVADEDDPVTAFRACGDQQSDSHFDRWTGKSTCPTRNHA